MANGFQAFFPIPKPEITFYGAAARERGRALANILEFTESTHYYLVEVELPRVEFSNGEIGWFVDGDGMVTIDGQIHVGAIYKNMPIGNNTKRIKLCPTEPWGMSFHLPGPIDWTTAHVLFTSKAVMEITVMKAPRVPQLPGVDQIANDHADVPVLTQAEIDEMLAEWLAEI